MEKKTYVAPETEIVELEAADVIRTSATPANYSGGGNGWSNLFGGDNRNNNNKYNNNNYGTDGPGSGYGESGTMLINDL